MQIDHSHVKLGKLPARHDPLVPRMVSLMTDAPSRPPTSADWSHHITNWGVMRNAGDDALGDCTAAAVAHFLQAMSAAARTEYTASDSDVVAFYSATTGYRIGHPETDCGGIETKVLRYLLQNGFCGRKIVGYGYVDPKDTEVVKRVIADLGGAYIGVDLPIVAQRQTVWGEQGFLFADRAPGSWGGHAVYCCGYDDTHVSFVSWGSLMKMTWGFWSTYVDEAYGILWAAMIKDGKSPSGIDVAALTAEVEKLRAA